MAVREVGEKPLTSPPAQPATVLDAVRPLILATLDKARTSQDLAKRLKVTKPQMDAWLLLLANDKVIEERTIRKSRTFSIRHPDEELKL